MLNTVFGTFDGRNNTHAEIRIMGGGGGGGGRGAIMFVTSAGKK